MRAPLDNQTFRAALRGLVDVNVLPFALRAMVLKTQRQIVRQGNRAVRREMKAQQYRTAALAGGGAREVARRARQVLA